MKLERKRSFYEKYIKRALDILCSLLFIVIFCWLFAFVALIVRVGMGRPVVFKQPRPGIIKNGKESIFEMIKFRTMTSECGEDGDLLPDDQRLTKFGSFLRSTSLDELPEVFCILRGTMSVVGPRPQLVRDMVFMNEQQRLRHTAKPGLTGLAQIKGRNAITWDEKIDWDLKYIENISFKSDVRIIIATIVSVLKKDGITDGENATALDYGDALLKEGKVSQKQYDELQKCANDILEEYMKGTDKCRD